ncbi:hypothetical protein QQX98_007442 [Neonectria punicea]|uniref:Uncharacterized protein n=1 Tax=Neonectria punicea TaxID=979145 RepID=A0ABR1GXX8_9HYPO
MTAFSEKVKIQARGSNGFLATVAEAVAWLCDALRVRPSEGLMLSDVRLGEEGGIELLPLEAVATGTPGNCWHELFKAGVIVSQPRPPSGRKETGLELSFDEMASLASIVAQLQIGHLTVLLGYSTMLIPVNRLDAGVQWHLEI